MGLFDSLKCEIWKTNPMYWQAVAGIRGLRSAGASQDDIRSAVAAGKDLGVPGLGNFLGDSLLDCALSAVFDDGAPGPVAVAGQVARRLGILRREGRTLFVKSGPLTASWLREEDEVQSFQLDGFRIGILRTDGTLFVKEGDLSANWVRQDDNVKAFQLEGTRIAMLKPEENGTLYVKEGELGANWVRLEDGVAAFQLKRDRIGILKTDGNLYVKEGDLSAHWIRLEDGIIAFELE